MIFYNILLMNPGPDKLHISAGKNNSLIDFNQIKSTLDIRSSHSAETWPLSLITILDVNISVSVHF